MILGTGWDKSSDNWGIACIILELYTGELYFSTHDSYEHYALIEQHSGPTPYHMAKKASLMKKRFILDDRRLKKYGTYFDWPFHKLTKKLYKK